MSDVDAPTVLLVEDDRELRELLSRLLAEAGYLARHRRARRRLRMDRETEPSTACTRCHRPSTTWCGRPARSCPASTPSQRDSPLWMAGFAGPGGLAPYPL